MDKFKLPPVINDIQHLIRSGYPILYIVSWEERRVFDHLLALASLAMKPHRNLYTWTFTDGYSDGPKGSGEAKGDPIAALDRIVEDHDSAIYIVKDFHPFIEDSQAVVRRLRDVYQFCAGTQKTLVILSPSLVVPPELQKEVYVIDYPLPAIEEAGDILDEQFALVTVETGRFYPDIPKDDREPLIKSLLGLTKEEIIKCVRKIMVARERISFEDVDYILEEKRQILRKTEILEFIPSSYGMSDVGGMTGLKRWCSIRKTGFTDAARAFGLPQPKGVLITGISGCGKSLAIQALANEWKLPLLRLDMGRVFAGFAGSPEESMRRAILTVEAVAPAILWIDEIEMGISVFSDSVESGSTSRIFASFLTWMQEKKSAVFIAATANDIDRLPPEMIRKGRFDEVFFVDLPNEEERSQIFKIHLENRGKSVTDITVNNLGHHAVGFTGAEIEQCIVNAMYACFSQGRELQISDIYSAMAATVPLSVTMKEQITKTKRWADNRAVKANE